MGTVMSQIQEIRKLQSCDNNGDIPESLRDVPGLQWLDVCTYVTDMWWQIIFVFVGVEKVSRCL